MQPDVEKEPGLKSAEDSSSVRSFGHAHYEEPGNAWQRFKDSFKPAEPVEFDTTGMTEEEIKNTKADVPMKRTLKNRHIQLIALGGSIGSGLFLTTAQSLSDAGPAGVLIAFGIIGVLILYPMMCCLGEVAVAYPIQGSFTVHSTRFVDDSWGFAMSFNYMLQWIVTYPLELIAAAMVIGYWEGDNNGAVDFKNRDGWVALFYTVFTMVGFFGARGYGEVEAALSIIKIITIVGFCIFGIWAACDPKPPSAIEYGPGVIMPVFGSDVKYANATYGTGNHFNTQFYHVPGAFSQDTNPVKGICSVFVSSVFAFSGTEMAALASAETASPSRTLPKAVRQVFWRVILFYIVSLLIAFFVVRSDDCSLTSSCPTDCRLAASTCGVDNNGGQSAAGNDGRSSLFVLAIRYAGVSGLPSVMNVVILFASLSVANTSVYACSRTLAAMANEGQLPRILGYIDRAGRPLVALGLTCAVGLIAFSAASPKYGEAFDWLLAISSQSTLFAWGSAGLNMIRMRMAMRAQGHSLDILTYKSPLGMPGAVLCVFGNLAVLGVQFWVGLFPIGASKPDGLGWFETYLATCVVIVCFIGHKLWYRNMPPKLKNIDLASGSRTKNNFEEEGPEIVEPSNPFAKYAKRTFNYWC